MSPEKGPTCDQCRERKPDVKTVIDPFRAEIYGNEVEMDLCDDCKRDRAADI